MMTRRVERIGPYLIAIADGYIARPLSGVIRERSGLAASVEQAQAEIVHQGLSAMAAGPWLGREQYDRALPRPAHVWVVGSDRWLGSGPIERGPALWRYLAGDEEASADYRVVIGGIDTPLAASDLESRWAGILASASLRDKVRPDGREFDDTAAPLLRSLALRYALDRRAPTEAIADPDWHLAYAGA